MRTGRPPIPTAIKAVKGTLRKSRRNLREPAPITGPPAIPIALPAAARPYWDWLVGELTALRVSVPADGPVLLLAACRFRDYLALEAFVAEHGRLTTVTMTNRTEREIVRPEVQLMNMAWRDALAALAQLGLTPSARSRVSVAPTPHPEDELEALIGPRRLAH